MLTVIRTELQLQVGLWLSLGLG